jgi:hypothetical protein
MSEKKESLWLIHRGPKWWVFRSERSAAQYRRRKANPGLYSHPIPAKWGPEHQKAR